MTEIEKTIAMLLLELSELFPGQFMITEYTHDIWLRRLKDVEPVAIQSALDEIGNESRKFPPSCGEIRTKAIELSTGHLCLPTGIQAWERVQQWYREAPPAGATDEQKRAYLQKIDKVELTDLERRALSSVGGSSVFQFSQNLMADRANFIRFFDAEVRSQFVEAAATQGAKALVGENTPAPQLPTHVDQFASFDGTNQSFCDDDNIPPGARQFLANLGITEPEEK